jgi:hypothetical protein
MTMEMGGENVNVCFAVLNFETNMNMVMDLSASE